MADQAPRSLRVLCFGDSLTAGYTNWGISFFPYGDTLRDDLRSALPSTDVQVDVEGFSGDQVRGAFLRRLQRACEKAKAAPYDWIIVLGGTNDLGWGQQPDAIYENLSRSLPLSGANAGDGGVFPFVSLCRWHSCTRLD